MSFSRLQAAIAAGVVASCLAAAWIYTSRQPRPASNSQTTNPQNAYVDATVCADCHADKAAGYQKTGMGRSFARVRPENTPAFGKPFRHKVSGSYFAMITRDGKLYQRRWQIGFDGKETNVDEKQADFVVGSGNHSKTYLHLTSRGALQVLPLSWYSEKGGYWDMSPGYDQPDYPGSVRPVHYECISCHNAYPKIPQPLESIASAEMIFAQPLPQGIDCQRCHGPGQRHVDLASAGGKPEQIRAAIVNPKRLDPDRELEVCLQCHMETTSLNLPHSIRRFDRAPFSYVPGQPLGDFSVEFDRTGGMKDRFEIAHGAYRLRQSQCYLQSAGKLRCTTCHDPHDIPRGPEATARYNGVCATCHATTLQRTAAGPHAAGADCIACHMPKRRTDDVVHVVMTDHLIQRHKPAGDLLASKAEVIESAAEYQTVVVPYYPAPLADTPENALYTAAAQVRDRRNLTEGLPRLANLLERYHPAQAGFYAELGQGYRAASDLPKAIPYFEEAARREPTAFRLVQFGNALMENRQFPQAEATLRRAIGLAPDEPSGWGTLGWVLWQQDKGAEARADLERAVALDPDVPEVHNNLANVAWGMGDQAAAEQQFREALRIQPGIADWRLNLARVLATRGEIAEARFQFEQAIRIKPDLAEARLDYGRLLADRGELAAAISQLEAAVRLQPDLWRAHFELGMALGRSGNPTAATEQMRIAASGSDPQVRAEAADVLQRLRR
ncbi:MAG: tetratricopeptide repeat protein [Acidobacteriia bacterium]|nr:tetratricopeptide repeat protein [Terriglobia bacterium]